MSPGKKLYRDLRPTTVSYFPNNVKSLAAQHPTGLVALAFDGANVAAGAAKLGGFFDYRASILDLTLGRPWIGTAVVLVDKMTAGTARSVAAIRHLGLSVITVQRATVCGQVKAPHDDVVLAAEAAGYALDPRVDEVVLVSGDGDLAPICEMARRSNTVVTVAGFRGTVSYKLVRAADEVVLLDGRHVIARDVAA